MGAAQAAQLLVSYYSMPNMPERDRQSDGPALAYWACLGKRRTRASGV